MKKVDNSIKITGMIVVAVLALGLLGFYGFMQTIPGNIVTANGQAVVSVMPDRIITYFNVETNELTAAAARDANAVIVDDLVLSLLKLGFDRDEIVTDNFNVYEEYDWNDGSREKIGFKAIHRISVELGADENLIGEVVDAGINAGALLSHINFGLSKELQSEYKAEALKLATADARVKASAMADGLDAELGRLVSTSDSNFGYSPWMVYEVGAESQLAGVTGPKVETEISVGEKEVSAQVSVVYKLK